VRRVQREALKDKSYRATPIGGEVGRFLRKLRWENASENTLLSYEGTLAKLSLEFADKQLADLGREDFREFLDENWGESAPRTRRQRLSCLKSFLEWASDERGLTVNHLVKERPPKVRDVDRQAYSPEKIDELRDAQDTLRDRIAVQLLGRLGLRRNELRLVKVKDIRLDKGTIRVHGKGGKIVDVPLAFRHLIADLEIHLVGRGANEYLVYPKRDVMRPMTSAGLDGWWKRCLKKAGLPESMLMHELRHSAADNLWRETGNLMLAKKLLRHSSVGTTESYLHPLMDDLEDALEALERRERGA
jgi:site-specific recombinase XerD